MKARFNKNQTSIVAVIAAIAILLTLSPLRLNTAANLVSAGGNHHGDDGDGNSASQIILQIQQSIQNSQVVSNDDR